MRKWSAVCNGCPISDFAVGTMPSCSDCFNYGGALSENESLAKELAQSEVVVKGVYNGVLDFIAFKRKHKAIGIALLLVIVLSVLILGYMWIHSPM